MRSLRIGALLGLLIVLTLVLCGCTQPTTPKPTTTTPAKITPTTVVTPLGTENIAKKVLEKYKDWSHYISKIVLHSSQSEKVICTVKYNEGAYKVVCSNGMIVFANSSGVLVKKGQEEHFSHAYVAPPLAETLKCLKENVDTVKVEKNNESNEYILSFYCDGSWFNCTVKPDGTIVSVQKDDTLVEFLSINTTEIPKITMPPEFLRYLHNETAQITSVQGNKTVILFYYSPYCPHCHEVLPLVENWTKLKNVELHVCNVNHLTDPICNSFANKIVGVPTVFVISNGTVKEYLGSLEIRKLDAILKNEQK